MSLNKIPSDIRLLVGSLVAIVIIAIVLAGTAPTPNAPPLSIHSEDRDGAMALWEWIQQSGYQTRELVADPIQLKDANVLFALDPEKPYSSDEADRIQRWVQRGNTLIVAGSPLTVNNLLAPYHVSMSLNLTDGGKLQPTNALLKVPPVQPVDVGLAYTLHLDRTDPVIYLADGTLPVLLSLKEGNGTVWVSGATQPFTNEGLSDPGSGEMIANILNALPRFNATIGFDEGKHGFAVTPSLSAWLFGSPPGWGVLLAIGITVIYLAVSGRRFGRPVPIPAQTLRRDYVEYIQAMGNLFRRSGQRSEVLLHYRGQLRRRLSERYSIDPGLDDIEFIKTLAFREPSIDAAALRDLFARLRKQNASEQDLLNTAIDVDSWLRRLI